VRPAPADGARRGLRGTVAAAGVAGLAALGYWSPSAALVAAGVRRTLGVEARLADAGAVALTFDDGPHAEGTPAVLDALGSAGAKATFFLAAEQVRRRPALAREVVARGHEVGVHCTRHRNLFFVTPAQARDDLARAEATIADATGVAPRLYRPPYGMLTAAALLHARSRGWRTILWTSDGRDWERAATAGSIARRVTHGIAGGEILLLHDSDAYSAPGSWWKTVAALPLVFEELSRRGLQTALFDA